MSNFDDMRSAVSDMTKADRAIMRHKLRHEPKMKSYYERLKKSNKQKAKSNFIEWWRSNWIAVAGLAVSLVSMLISLIALLK